MLKKGNKTFAKTQIGYSAVMQLKYGQYINELGNCPPAYYEGRTFVAYRFVFENLQHRNNFLPVLAVNPKRISSPEFAANQAKCLGYALSLFDSVANAERRYQQISRYNKNFYKTVGTHIAGGQIVKADGLASPVDDNGHISLHESEQAALSAKFRVLGEVHHAQRS